MALKERSMAQLRNPDGAAHVILQSVTADGPLLALRLGSGVAYLVRDKLAVVVR